MKARTSWVGGRQVDSRQQLGGGRAVGPGQRAHLLDEVEQLLALLADQGLAQQVAEPADVGAQRAVASAASTLSALRPRLPGDASEGAGGGVPAGTLPAGDSPPRPFLPERLPTVPVSLDPGRFSGGSGVRWLLSALLTGAAPLRSCFPCGVASGRWRTALSDGTRIGRAQSGQDARPRCAAAESRPGAHPSCPVTYGCHTYVAVGYGTVAKPRSNEGHL